MNMNEEQKGSTSIYIEYGLSNLNSDNNNDNFNDQQRDKDGHDYNNNHVQSNKINNLNHHDNEINNNVNENINNKYANGLNNNLENKKNANNINHNKGESKINIQSPNESQQPDDSQQQEFTIFGYPFSKIKWSNVIWLTICHTCGIIGYFYGIIYGIKAWSIIWIGLLGSGAAIGLTVGAHRLWAHKSFKAVWILELFIIIIQSISMAGSAFAFARDHRTHHKHSDTPADPKNSRRGFFYSHMGWWLLKKDPIVIIEGSKLNYDDLYANWLVNFQHKHYYGFVTVFSIIIPIIVPYFLWDESLEVSILTCVFTRYILVLHHFWTFNSLAHLWGDKIYDTKMRPRENQIVNYLSMGEGHHNFHHTFPSDYLSSEKGPLYSFDPSTVFIKFFQHLGMIYDCKRVSKEVIEQRLNRTGCPEKIKKRSKCMDITLGLIDWFVGSLFVTWAFWLGLALKCIYLALTSELTLDNLLKDAF